MVKQTILVRILANMSFIFKSLLTRILKNLINIKQKHIFTEHLQYAEFYIKIKY
jgi:hypothetical protein